MSTTTHHRKVGMKVRLPDAGDVTILSMEDGYEYGSAVTYITGINTLGQTVTRWVYR